jgi:predicted MPP superfamily phosphohydrolase
VTVGLVLAAVAGSYVSRRLTAALAEFGVGDRRLRVIRWLIRWLMLGFPIVIIVSVIISLLLGSATLPRYDGLAAGWLLAFPFAWAILVVFQSFIWLIPIDLVYLTLRGRNPPRATRLRALAVLVVLATFAIYTPLRIFLARGDLRIRHHDISNVHLTTPLRIAFVADVQQDDHTTAERAREVYAIVNTAQPDMILSGGDWINSGPDHIASAASAASTLRSRLGTFSVRGDHEHFAYIDRERSVREVDEAMRANNVSMLVNEVRWFEHGGKRIAVVFLNYNYIVRVDAATIATLVASVSTADYAIAVTHQFDATLAALLRDKVDLVLAAHTHGGQINPVFGVMHVNLARLETEYVDGRYQLGARTTVIVTAGIGMSIIPIRYASPGSVEIIELR